MKTLLFLSLAFALPLAAQKTTTKSTAKTKTPAAPAQLQEMTIPAGAVQYEEGSYRYTDAAGKRWIYHKTPFGVARSLEIPPPIATPALVDETTTATVQGETVRFEKPSPFGPAKWDKKIAELDENEKRILERQKIKQ